MFGCFRRVIVLVIILVLIAAVWLFRGKVKEEWRAIRGLRDPAELASPELATIASGKLDSLRDHTADRVALGAVELQSLVQYKYTGLLPAFAQNPHVELHGDRMRLRVRVPSDKLPNVKGLGDVTSFLPDTADVEISGTLLPLDSNRVALGVDQVQAAGIPLPARMINDALQRIGRRDEPGLARDAIAVTLPAGVRAAYIRSDSLILLARPRN